MLLKCQVILPYFTAIPEDVATNTIWFGTADPDQVSQDHVNEAAGRIDAAYTEVDDYISALVPRGGASTKIKFYDMADPTPRHPVDEQFFSINAAALTTSLPMECAAVLSYHGPFVSGTSAARRRGRFYLGPLTTGASSTSSATVFPQVSSGLRTAMIAMAGKLSLPINGALGVKWVQHSTVGGLYINVDAGWVDDEFDTQRRRGRLATLRQTFDVIQ